MFSWSRTYSLIYRLNQQPNLNGYKLNTQKMASVKDFLIPGPATSCFSSFDLNDKLILMNKLQC